MFFSQIWFYSFAKMSHNSYHWLLCQFSAVRGLKKESYDNSLKEQARMEIESELLCFYGNCGWGGTRDESGGKTNLPTQMATAHQLVLVSCEDRKKKKHNKVP